MENECTYCGKELGIYEKESPYTDESGNIMCEDCYDDHFREICPICENWYDKPTKPEECFFIVAKEVAQDVCSEGLKPGIYQTIKWPYWLGATGFGFETLFTNSIKLLRELDINSMMSKLYENNYDIGADEICPDCVDRFTSGKYVYTKWCDLHTRIHKNINERSIIKKGY